MTDGLAAQHRAGQHDGDEPHAGCWYCERQAADFADAQHVQRLTVADLIDSLGAVNPALPVRIACEPLPLDSTAAHALQGLRAAEVDGQYVVILTADYR